DDNQLRASAARFHDIRPEMNIVAVNVRGPRADVAGVDKLVRLRAEFDTHDRLQPGLASGGTNGALQLGSTESSEETTVHGPAIQGAQSSAVGIGQDRFTAEPRDDPAETFRDFVQRLVPADAAPNLICLCGNSRPFDRLRAGPKLSMRSAATLRFRRSLRRNPPHGIQ